MIENIRKYNGLIILAIVTVVVALVIGLQSSSVRGMGGGAPYIKIDGRTYTDKEYRKLGLGALEVIGSLASSGDFQLYRYLYSVAPGAMNPQAGNEARETYFTNRMLLRQAAANLGVYPGEEEISERIRNIRTFATQGGEFNPEAYATFIKRGLGPLGMTENDFRELISDIIATDKVSEIIGAGLSANSDAVARSITFNEQKVSGYLARFDIAPFKNGIKPSDEELKGYWELIQDAFTTEPQRKFSYILVSPDMPEEPAADAKEETPAIAEATLSDEAKEKAAKEKAEAEAKREAELAEAKRTAQRALDEQVNLFFDKLLDQKGENFDQLVAEEKWELKDSGLISQSAPPADFALKLRSNSRAGRVVDELFKISVTADTLSKISEPVPAGENQWLIARLDEEIPARPKTFEEAKPEVLKQFVDEKAAEAMKEAVDKANESIKTALTEGKTFEQAATDAGMIGFKTFTDIDASYRPSPLTEPNGLFQSTSGINSGDLADPIIQNGRAFIVQVTGRSIVKDEERATRVENQTNVMASQMQMTAFSDWLATNKRAANVQPLYRP